MWDAHIEEFEIFPGADYIGIPLQKLSWRKLYGVNILYVKRGNRIIFITRSSSSLYPCDVIGVVGTDEQLQQFAAMLVMPMEKTSVDKTSEEIVINKILVSSLNDLEGKSVKESCINDRTGGSVIGIERGEERILNPVSTTIFQKGDIVWLAGER